MGNAEMGKREDAKRKISFENPLFQRKTNMECSISDTARFPGLRSINMSHLGQYTLLRPKECTFSKVLVKSAPDKNLGKPEGFDEGKNKVIPSALLRTGSSVSLPPKRLRAGRMTKSYNQSGHSERNFDGV